MDGRKKNGGARKGAGRKPKAEEENVRLLMDSIAPPDVIWNKLYQLANSGDMVAIKTWLNYRYGMPKQQTDVTTNGKDIPTGKIVITSEGVPPDESI